jgi:hypothetical protein
MDLMEEIPGLVRTHTNEGLLRFTSITIPLPELEPTDPRS